MGKIGEILGKILDKSEFIIIMPHDVWTWWNLTCDMLKFTLKYKEAIKIITSDLNNNLCKCELNDEEWELVRQLANTLKVMCPS